MKSSHNSNKAKAALHARFSGPKDKNGYTQKVQDNLVSGVRMDQFEDDLRQGNGNELRMKFCAVHSSAALVVNCFAPFKDSKKELLLLGGKSIVKVTFEKN